MKFGTSTEEEVELELGLENVWSASSIVAGVEVAHASSVSKDLLFYLFRPRRRQVHFLLVVFSGAALPVLGPFPNHQLPLLETSIRVGKFNCLDWLVGVICLPGTPKPRATACVFQHDPDSVRLF